MPQEAKQLPFPTELALGCLLRTLRIACHIADGRWTPVSSRDCGRLTATTGIEAAGIRRGTLFFEVVDQGEISRRMHSEVFVTQVEVPVE